MTRLHPFQLFASLLSLSSLVSADVTLYTGDSSTSTSTALAAGATYTGLAAYDPTTLTPPTAPSPAVTANAVSIQPNSAGLAENGYLLSVPQKGNFLGFSIELSIATSVMGTTATNLKPQFLNYMANIQNRAGVGPVIRVGGNSQEDSTIFTGGLADGATMDKIKVSSGVTDTPIINYSTELFYIMSNVTSLVGTEWYFGLAFNQTDVDSPTGNIPIAATYAQQILGSNLRGLSIGNEPDLYVDHSKRTSGWTLSNFTSEFIEIKNEILTDGTLSNQVAFVGPSVCCQVEGFELDDLFNANWLTDNEANLAAVTVQHYPTNNCQVNGNVINAQDIFSDFLNHTNAQYLVSLYLANSATVLAAGKEIVMLETNTASCGGFAGLSDSFGAAMWMTDYALQMAYGNFTTALVHVGGQNVYYNPFTPPPSNESSTKEWTTGSVYYASLVVAEAFGQSNVSRIVDVTPTAEADANYIYHPAYAIYENDAPSRMVLFNFIDDSTGASDLQTTISLNGSTLSASSVSVRYLRASSVSEQYNITWANQTMGTSFDSDGRLYNTQETVTITCTDGSCVIPVYAPSIAVVFLTENALTLSSVSDSATSTYATSVIGSGSATVDPRVLETSNGQNLGSDQSGSTSSGSASGAERRARYDASLVLAGVGGMVGVALLALSGAVSI